MTTKKYHPKDTCNPAENNKNIDYNHVITFWDCLFGKDRWRNLYRKRGDVLEEERIQRMNARKDPIKTVTILKPTSNKRNTFEKKPKTIFHREIYSIEIEPTNLLRFIWPWKKDKYKAKDSEHIVKNKQENSLVENEPDNKKIQSLVKRNRRSRKELELRANRDELNVKKIQTEKKGDKYKTEDTEYIMKNKQENTLIENKPDGKRIQHLKRYMRGEKEMEVSANEKELNVKKMQTEKKRERQRKMYHVEKDENKYSHKCFPSSNFRRTGMRVPPPTFITAQLTDLSTKIDKLEDTIKKLSSNNQSHSNKLLGVGDKNSIKSKIQKVCHNRDDRKTDDKMNFTRVCRNVTRQVYNNNRNVDETFKTVEDSFTNVCEDHEDSLKNITKQPRKYSIQRSRSNPSLLRIHASEYSNCHDRSNSHDACILIHTRKKDVCVHGSYLDVKQSQSWWNQIRNMSVVFFNQVFYRNTSNVVSENEDGNKETETENEKENRDRNEFSTDNESFQSFDEYDFGEELNSNCSKYRKSVSYTILNHRHMELTADHAHDKKQVENVARNIIVPEVDSNDISRITPNMIDGDIDDPVEHFKFCSSVKNVVIKSDNDLFYNNLTGEMHSSEKYKLLFSEKQNFCDNSYQQYLINNNRQNDNGNDNLKMKQNMNKNFGKNDDDLCHRLEENQQIYQIEKHNEFEASAKQLETFRKIIQSKFESKYSGTRYEENLTETLKSEYIDTLKNLSILEGLTKVNFYSFFQGKEENDSIFLSNLVGTPFYQVYESK
ncbi:MATH and LRR domain-containing protein PFE0570w-like [Nilaparvata lugens]|uniref:MATH and LRR domain-containing protein PFE0570w-like n=1 Tax=Nilaparvata lugens TaxID=108931 RepID=UPI00193D872D|nr:MATH and LRR domain-containing protein PFE0570w-like [Nilaparvata lugens]